MTSKSPKTSNFDRIDPTLCINAKVRKLHRLLNSAYQKQIRPFGLQGSMLSIMFIIGKKKRINQKTLADMLVLDQSTMSRDLKKLADKQWLKTYKGADNRHTELELTRQGYALLEQVTPVWERTHHAVQAVLGSFNIQQIDAITEAIKTNLNQIKV